MKLEAALWFFYWYCSVFVWSYLRIISFFFLNCKYVPQLSSLTANTTLKLLLYLLLRWVILCIRTQRRSTSPLLLLLKDSIWRLSLHLSYRLKQQRCFCCCSGSSNNCLRCSTNPWEVSACSNSPSVHRSIEGASGPHLHTKGGILLFRTADTSSRTFSR